jgi:hypothetical protein
MVADENVNGLKVAKVLRFWLPKNGYEQEIIIPGEYVRSIILRAAGHEAGHAIVAHHFGARVLGIGISFMPERNQVGMFLNAQYGWKGWSIDTRCVVMAAGPAADALYQGGFDDLSASGDLQDIKSLTGKASLEPYLGVAKGIVSAHPAKMKRIVADLGDEIARVEQRRLEILPDKHVGTFLLDEEQLVSCFAEVS